jgi:hypothetical protein
MEDDVVMTDAPLHLVAGNMDPLPDELFCKILLKVNWREIITLGRTCKRIWGICQDNGLWFVVARYLLRQQRRMPRDEFYKLGPSARMDVQMGLVVENMLRWLNHSNRYMLTSLVDLPPEKTDAVLDEHGAVVVAPGPLIPGTVAYHSKVCQRKFTRIAEFGMAYISDDGELGPALSTTALSDEYMVAGTDQAIGFSRLLQNAFGTLVSPLTKPDGSLSHRPDNDPLVIVMAKDETKAHFKLQLPLHAMLQDWTHIWYQFVRICWIEARRQVVMSQTVHNLSAFYNIKMRNVQMHEMVQYGLNQRTQAQLDAANNNNNNDDDENMAAEAALPGSAFPTIIECPTEEAINKFELDHPGGALTCTTCKRVVSIGGSERFNNNTASALMPFHGENVVFCTSECMLKAMHKFNHTTVLCSNPKCRSAIPLTRALGSIIAYERDPTRRLIMYPQMVEYMKAKAAQGTFPPEVRLDIIDVVEDMTENGMVWWNLAHYNNNDAQFIVDQNALPFAFQVNRDTLRQISRTPAIPTIVNGDYCSFHHHAHQLKQLPTSAAPTAVDNYLGTSTETWDDRLERYQLFKQRLTDDYRYPIVGDRRGIAQHLTLPPKTDINRGACLPLGTLGLGLPAVKAFFNIPFLTLGYGVVEQSIDRFYHLESRALLDQLNSTKFNAFCTGSCMRGSQCITRCLNRACRAVFDLEMAPLSLECYELAMVFVDKTDHKKTFQNSKGYVCDEFCAKAYVKSLSQRSPAATAVSTTTQSSSLGKLTNPNNKRTHVAATSDDTTAIATGTPTKRPRPLEDD